MLTADGVRRHTVPGDGIGVAINLGIGGWILFRCVTSAGVLHVIHIPTEPGAVPQKLPAKKKRRGPHRRNRERSPVPAPSPFAELAL